MLRIAARLGANGLLPPTTRGSWGSRRLPLGGLEPNHRAVVDRQSSCTRSQSMSMNEDRFAGTARNVGGRVEQGFGRATGDTKTEAQGAMKQASGAVQDLYGQAKDAAGDAYEQAKDVAS